MDINTHPLYKFSSTEIWPIICKYANYSPIIVYLFCGSKNPDDSEEYLRQLLHEFDALRVTGFQNATNVFVINLCAH